MADVAPDELIARQRTADTAFKALSGLDGDEHRAQWEVWGKAAETVQAAVTAHAREAGVDRFQVERAVKSAARHPAPDEATTG